MTKFISIFVLLMFCVACRKTNVIFNSVANENLELPLLLNLNRKSCVFDAQSGILKYSIDENSLENFSPYVEFQAHSDVTFDTTDLSNGTVNYLGDLELNKAYSISIRTDDEINEFTLIFTDIPIIQIITHDPIISGPKTLSRMILNYPDKERTSDNNWAGIKQRGWSSLKYDKKSFGIGIYSDKDIDEPLLQSYFDLKLNQKWILDAMFVDQSRLRNKSSFDLWSSMSGPANHIGVKSEFVEVFINHQSQGIYCFTENYTEEFLNMNSQSVLYKGIDNSETTHFDDLAEDTPNSALWDDWEQKFPDPSETIVWNDFEVLSTLIVNGSNTVFKNNIAQLIDLDNVIDYFLFINLCGGTDNVGKNWLFFKQDPSAKFNILPWDMDGTWGRSPFADEITYSTIITNNFFERLEETDPENYKLRLKERWEALRLLEFSETNLINLFTTNFNQLKSYEIVDLENKLWRTKLNLENEQSYIISWIYNRLEFLDQHFDN